MSQLVLSLFPGIGMLDMAFEQEGFCVVRGPDVLWGSDVKSFHPPAGKFDGVIGGQQFTFSECCELQGLPADFLHEAPFTKEGKYRVVNNGVPLPMGRAIAKAVREATE